MLNDMKGRINSVSWSAWFQSAVSCVSWIEDHSEKSEAHSPTRCPSPQELLQLTASVAAGANDMSIEESLSETLTLCCKTWASVLSVRAWWSQSAGWTELWSFGGTEPSFRCRSGWPTWRAACNPAQRNVWEINPSRSSSARSGPSHTQTE